MEYPALPAELIQLVGEYMALRFQIPAHEGEQMESDKLHAFIAIDKSASMSGGPIRDAKGALVSLLQKFKKVDISTTVYLYSSKLISLLSDDIGHDAVIQQVEAVKAGGGTLFAPVITEMMETIKRKACKNVFCVWLTDGQDNKGLAALQPVMERFQQFMEEEAVSIGVYTIGFSGDHDANLLNRLCQSGTKPGSFQFVPPGGRIPVAINNVYALAFESASWARFISCDRSITKKVEIERTEGLDELLGLVYISEEDLEDARIEVHRGENVEIFSIDAHRSEAREFKELVFLVTHFVSARIIQILELGGDQAGKRLAEIRPLIEEMDRRVKQLHQESRSYRTFYRKQCQPYFNSTFELIQNYFNTLRDNAGAQLSNMQLANLNNLAHKNALKKNLERKIAREVGSNVEMLNETELLIEQFMKNLDKAELDTRYATSVDHYGECLLTARNWIEALAEGDCFCVTLHLERPQNLLGDALEIRVKKVNTSVLTCDGFVDSALFETKAGQMIQAERSYQHGEQPLPASSLVNGLPNEVINGIMPVYINEDHWQVARLRIKPMIAWDITVDVLGYLPKQLYTFPFSVLVRALIDEQSEFQKFQTQLIKDTCLAIYRDNRDAMRTYNVGLFDEYLAKPLTRLPESIPNNPIFLTQLFCAAHTGDVVEVQRIFSWVFEEEFRRRFKVNKDLNLHTFCIEMLNLDLTPHLEGIKQSLKSGVKYASMFYKEGATPSGDTPTGETPAQAPSTEVSTVSVDVLCEKAARFIDKVNQQLAQGGALSGLARALALFDGREYTSLDAFGLTTNEQKLALIFQAFRDRRNAERKESVEAGVVVDVFDAAAAAQLIQEIAKATLERECLVYKNKLLTEMKGDEFTGRSVIFASSTDLDEAAGSLYGVKQGSMEFQLFYKQLMQPFAELPAQKLKLLNRAEHKGIKLIHDSSKTQDPVHWVPNNKVLHKIWAQHYIRVSKEEWIDAVPEKQAYLEHKYMRLEGLFVPYTHPRNNVVDPRHWENKPAKSPQNPKKVRAKKGKQPARRGRRRRW